MTRRKDPAATRTPVSEMEAAGHALPQFEPVPRKYRHDGWTPERQKAFIAALAESGNVTAACEHVGMTTEGAYYLLDGVPIVLDPHQGPRGPAGEPVDCVAWMDRAVGVSREEYLAAAALTSIAGPSAPALPL